MNREQLEYKIRDLEFWLDHNQNHPNQTQKQNLLFHYQFELSKLNNLNMSTTFTITLPEPLWTIKEVEQTDNMRHVERHFCITVASALDDMKTDPNVMNVIRMVKRANKIFNKRMKDKRNRFDVELKVADSKTIIVTLNTTFNSKELFQIINTK